MLGFERILHFSGLFCLLRWFGLAEFLILSLVGSVCWFAVTFVHFESGGQAFMPGWQVFLLTSWVWLGRILDFKPGRQCFLRLVGSFLSLVDWFFAWF